MPHIHIKIIGRFLGSTCIWFYNRLRIKHDLIILNGNIHYRSSFFQFVGRMGRWVWYQVRYWTGKLLRRLHTHWNGTKSVRRSTHASIYQINTDGAQNTSLHLNGWKSILEWQQGWESLIKTSDIGVHRIFRSYM